MRRVSVLVGLVAWMAACTAAGGAVNNSGIIGRIVAGPTCPVESVLPSPRCAPRPLAATVRIYAPGHRSHARVVRSGRDGQFRVGLAPGTYVVAPLGRPGSPLPRPPAATRVKVRSERYTRITIIYDTGIR
jgi:hypothetical protein